ncbi:unnamed protein product [Allacma fusca]|uniref:Uncharacterized protein n=1 Tax=Allacma fusca TaxID=39272 RepID=A0A8J2JA72_9HEXA|nr:unnamed protein product [Allacma fusca]
MSPSNLRGSGRSHGTYEIFKLAGFDCMGLRTRFFCSQLVAPIRDENGDICLYILNYEDLTATSQDEQSPQEAPNHLMSRFDRAKQSVRQSLRRKGSTRNSSVRSKQGHESLPTIHAGRQSPSEIVIEPKVQIQSPSRRPLPKKHSESPTEISVRKPLLSSSASTYTWNRGGDGRRSGSSPRTNSQIPPSSSTTFASISHPYKEKERAAILKLSRKTSGEKPVGKTFVKPPVVGVQPSESASFSIQSENSEARGWPAPIIAPSTPSTVTAQSIAQLRTASSLDRIESVSTQVVSAMPSRASTSNLSANILEWKGNGHLLVRPHTIDNIYLKAQKSQMKGFPNVSNSDSDLARHRISVIEPRTSREKKSPSLSNLTHQDGLSRYKMSIQENGSGKFFQGVKVGEKVAQETCCFPRPW